ncbi:MAG: hypothetical protein V7K27_00205 [Nostoc sp.]|uniref:hypothetical protein n=1 Tax=Nostoc sp. TaxID=1180 RepID=UPI002FF5DD9C
MSCTTTVHGAGLNTNGCGKLPNEGDYTFSGLATFQDSSYFGCPCKRFFLDGVDQGNGYIFYPDAYVVSTTCVVVVPKYDCINGACTLATIHNTNGLYASLSDCEVACGTGCSGKCVSNADWAQIESLSNQIMNRNCNT